MTRRVLVPVDEFLQAKKSLAYILSEHPCAEVTVLHVIDSAEVSHLAPQTLESELKSYYEKGHDTVTSLITDVQRMACEYGVRLSTTTKIGRPSQTIVDYAEQHHIDQIVIDGHGHSSTDYVSPESVAETVDCRSPVLVTII
ncbi:universal stress protein [Halococcus saccharolyticus]|uniref:UspA domain protein n=1 Tax=Halococcus saccharolyticus DSM 5350 TaxID=1227455 RepID=M0MK49_9EURY|nr:universal stress protein [Halococcus saccharolyticus]EMA46021.1 UspA domain protein [Halococcus saccharolyticus DSM 5350]